MKKSILLLTLLTMVVFTYGQTLPNHSFETWETNAFPNYEEPPPWNTPNPYTGLAGVVCVTKSDDAFTGDFSARLETIEINMGGNTFQAPGLVTYADFNIDLLTAEYSFSGGLFMQEKVKTLSGKYKFQGVDNDSASVLIYCYRHPEGEPIDTIGVGLTYLHDVTAWTDFSVDMFYFSAATPDTFNVLLMSTGTFEMGNMPPGSVLLLDDIMIETLVGTPENKEIEQASIYPVPANEMITIELTERNDYTLAIYDINGRLVKKLTFTGRSVETSIGSLSKGVYTCRISDKAGPRYAGTFVKQ